MTESGTPDGAVDDDPDAPWRRDYAGPEPAPPRPPASTWARPTSPPVAAPLGAPAPDPWSRDAATIAAGTRSAADASELSPPVVDPEAAERARQAAIAEAPGSAGPGFVGAVGLLVVVGVVVAAIAAVGILNDGEPSPSALPTIPESVDELWSVDLQMAVDVVIVDGVVVVREPEGLTGFDARTGDERWTWAPEDAPAVIEVDAAGDVVLVALDRPSASPVAIGIDPATGDELWNRNVAEFRNVFVLRDRIIEFEFDEQAGQGRFAFLSPDTGVPLGERLGLLGLTTTPPYLPATTGDDNDLVLYDLDTDERIGTALDWDELVAVTVAGGRVIGLTGDGSLALYDDAGGVADEIDVTLGPDQRSPDEIFSVPGSDVVVLGAGGSSIGVAIADDTLEIRWSARGQVSLVERTDAGARAILESDGSGPGERSLVVDPIDGDVVFDVEPSEAIVSPFETESFGRNGLVYRDGSRLVGLDESGNELWELDQPGGYVVDDGVLVEFDDDGITVYG